MNEARAQGLVAATIRRYQGLHPNTPYERADLIVFVDDHGLLQGAGQHVSLMRTAWPFSVVKGPLSLRAALLDQPRAILTLPPGMRVPQDIGQRCWLRRSLRVLAEDVVTAATGVVCQPFTDAAVADAVLNDVDGLFDRAQGRRWHGVSIREGEVINLLELNEQKIGRRTAPELLAGWLVDGPPEASAMLRITLREAHFEVHDWLVGACSPSGLQALVTAGALGGCQRGRIGAAFDMPANADQSWARLTGLVRQAIEAVWRRDPAIATRWLAPAERRAGQLELDLDEANTFSLLQAGFDGAICALAAALVAGHTPAQAAFDRLHLNLHADPRVVEVVEALARLTRFTHPSGPSPQTVVEWAQAHRDDSAWADTCARVARRGHARLPDQAQGDAAQVLNTYRRHRNQLNHAFATALKDDEIHAYRRQSAADGMSLHLTAAEVVRPLTEHGHVLLVVLDGCDFAAFYELLADLRSELRLGLGRPKHLQGTSALPSMMAALSPLPTLTQVGRRAIFGGQIPQNDTLTDQERQASNASNDKTAFTHNQALKDLSRELFLKGDLHTGGDAALVSAIEGDTQVVAVVFNGIDDHLSSRETTLHTRWTADSIHPALRKVLLAANRCDRAIVLTSDHGHTPFWDVDQKVKADEQSSQRFSRGVAPTGAVTFGGTPWRAGTMHILSDMGAYVSVQRTGYHGGAALEEVVVPLALLKADGAAATRPDWWAHTRQAFASTPATTPTRPVVTEVIEGWQAEVHPALVPLIQFLDQHGQITEAEVARMADRRTWRRLSRALTKLNKSGALGFAWHQNSQGGVGRIVKRSDA